MLFTTGLSVIFNSKVLHCFSCYSSTTGFFGIFHTANAD